MHEPEVLRILVPQGNTLKHFFDGHAILTQL